MRLLISVGSRPPGAVEYDQETRDEVAADAVAAALGVEGLTLEDASDTAARNDWWVEVDGRAISKLWDDMGVLDSEIRSADGLLELHVTAERPS